ncbi:hypothetical protein, partial [Sphingobium terrigena]|uniref:hypothetical protein n=1 Tax=Sphingobium terrigena TaxID=2304063 RepID=UPI0015FFB829
MNTRIALAPPLQSPGPGAPAKKIARGIARISTIRRRRRKCLVGRAPVPGRCEDVAEVPITARYSISLAVIAANFPPGGDYFADGLYQHTIAQRFLEHSGKARFLRAFGELI